MQDKSLKSQNKSPKQFEKLILNLAMDNKTKMSVEVYHISTEIVCSRKDNFIGFPFRILLEF